MEVRSLPASPLSAAGGGLTWASTIISGCEENLGGLGFGF